jgi:glutathione S-transferase
MVLKLYGASYKPFVRLVAAVLLEKQVPFELVVVDLASREHKMPQYLAKQPFGQVPCIVCDSLDFIYQFQTPTDHIYIGLGLE